MDGFKIHLDALFYGSEKLGIEGAEERRKTIAQLEELRAAWEPIASAGNTLLSDNTYSEAIGVVKARNMEAYELTERLVTTIEGRYANPAVLVQADVVVLELVGRQATMTQKIAKNACKTFSGNAPPEIKEPLQKSMNIYEVSLTALIEGMPGVGVYAAPTPKIAEALKKVRADWQKMLPYLDDLLNGKEMARDLQIELFRHMANEMHDLERIAHKYVEYSKHEH
ncbi:MAG: type IV pili methyl-accepting chemotaxis transducer N-terminal domain-containing protein [Pseudomonadota bacterium]